MAEVAHEVIPDVTALDNWILDTALRATVEAKLASDRDVYEALVTLIRLKDMVDDLLTPISGAPDEDEDGDDGQADFDPRTSLPLLAEAIVRLIEGKQIQFLNTVDHTSNLFERMGLFTDDIKARLAAKRESLLPTYSDVRKSYSEARRGSFPEGWITGS